MHAQLTYKQNEKQYYKVVLLFCIAVLLQAWKAQWLYLSKLTNSKQPSRRNAKVKRQVCYLKTSSTSLYNNAYKNSLNSDEKSIFLAVNNLLRFSTPQFTQISSVNGANPEKIRTTIWIFWISMAHIKGYFPTTRS